MGLFTSKKRQSSSNGVKTIFGQVINMMSDVVDALVIEDEDWEYENGIRTRAYSYCARARHETHTDGITWYIGSGPHCYINRDDAGYYWYAGRKYGSRRNALIASMLNFTPRTDHPIYGSIDFYSMFVKEYSIQ